MKYNEEEILNEVKKYVESTYNQHYVNGNDIQVNDLIMAIGHGEGAYVSNAIEYLARYGKKDGRNVKDLYKAIHNIILLINMNHFKSETITNTPQTQKKILVEDLDLIENDYQKQLILKGIL